MQHMYGCTTLSRLIVLQRVKPETLLGCYRPFWASRSISSKELGDDGLPKDYKLKSLKAGSRRLDTFLNRASGMSSSQTSKLILGGRVRVNEEVLTKRSYNVQKEDSIDVWIGPCQENSNFAEIERYEVVDYDVTDSGYDIQIKSWKKFLVENWRGS
ncbi:hypothetical protein KIN20_017148 [Parelaphostrongylus tenuis]|uniref:RNA-binding S4 domain-containing protein n=1 Tax=Parelaphostrongylus tenuis TaxID=148309 RepID=A0AAD5MHJ1_PARTN|nr:hypothetical protein KIN20_017148 [Parelaphostrongylus tenuis]